MVLQVNSQRYLENFKLWNGHLFIQLNECETKGERKSVKRNMILELRKEELPKVPRKEIEKYINQL